MSNYEHKDWIFVHDHKFQLLNGQIYTYGTITDKTLARYCPFGPKGAVLARAEKCVAGLTISKVDADFVDFHFIEGQDFKEVFSTKLYKNSLKILKLCKVVDVAVLRLPSILGYIFFLFYIFTRKNYYVELVGDARSAMLTSGKLRHSRYIAAALAGAITKIAVMRAKGVIYVTQSTLQKLYPTTGMSAAASNVEIDACNILATPRTISFEATSCVIGLIGSLGASYKGVDIAIRALAFLRAEGFNCCLRVLGAGSANHLVALANELNLSGQVVFDGVRSPGKDVNVWLDQVDIYVQPSRTEGLPRSLIEAMSRGLPCIGTRVGGIPELLEDANLIPVDDARGLALKIIGLMRDPVKYCKSSARNIEFSRRFTATVLEKTRSEFWDAVASAECLGNGADKSA